MAGLHPAPGSDPGSTLDDEVGQVPVVVVHHPEESVPQGDVLVLQVGSVYHQVTGDLLASLLQQRCLTGQLERTGGIVVVVEDLGSSAHQVYDHLLPLFPDSAPQCRVSLGTK